MKKNKNLGCLSLLLLCPLTMAMQPLDDETLSTTTGQDGLTIGVGVSKIDFNQIALINTNNSTYTNKSALVVAATPGASSPAVGVNFVQTFNADGTIQNNTSQSSLQVVIDTDKGTGTKGAFANMNVSFASGVNGLRIRPLSVYLVPDNINAISSIVGSYTRNSIFNPSTTTLKSPNIKELLRTDNIDIEFVANNKPGMNIQLGASPQGYLVVFDGALKSICGATAARPDGCTFNLVSGSTGAMFDLQMTGKDNTANGFSLSGFHAGVEGAAGSDKGGFVFGNYNSTCATTPSTCVTSDKFDLAINNLKLGDVGSTNVNIFNGLPNGSMGNFGIKGASITDFKMRVSGM